MEHHQDPEHQRHHELYHGEEGEEGERGSLCCCPVCGGMHHMPWGPMKRKHMMQRWGGMGPWAWRRRPMGMWMMPMMGFMCVGPVLMAMAAGFVLGRKSHYWKTQYWKSRCE